jgi:hypothetical protein
MRGKKRRASGGKIAEEVVHAYMARRAHTLSKIDATTSSITKDLPGIQELHTELACRRPDSSIRTKSTLRQ